MQLLQRVRVAAEKHEHAQLFPLKGGLQGKINHLTYTSHE